MANRNSRDGGLKDWERLCFDHVFCHGVSGPCELDDCDDADQKCKIRILINKGVLPETAIRRTSTLIQHACGCKEEPLFDASDNMNEFISTVRGKYPAGFTWNSGDS